MASGVVGVVVVLVHEIDISLVACEDAFSQRAVCDVLYLSQFSDCLEISVVGLFTIIPCVSGFIVA